MPDLRHRLRSFDRLEAPELWPEIEDRAAAPPPARHSSAPRRLNQLLIYGATVLAGIGVVLAVTAPRSSTPAVTAGTEQAAATASVDVTPSPPPSSTPGPIIEADPSATPPPAEPVSAQVSQDGLVVEFELDRGVAQLSQRVWATVRIRNQNAEPVVFNRARGCEWPAEVSATVNVPPQPTGRTWDGAAGAFKEEAVPAAADGGQQQISFTPEGRVDLHGNFGCLTVAVRNDVPPGGHVEYRGAWDTGTPGAPVEPGVYRLTATFAHAGLASEQDDSHLGEEFNPFRVEVELDLKVVPGARDIRLSPAEAVDAALSDQRFAAEVEAAENEGGFCCGAAVRFVNGAYEVSVGRDNPPPFETVIILVDPETGAVIDFKITRG